MKKFLGIATCAVICLASGTPASAADPLGKWSTESGKATVAIVKCGDAICGNIVALKEPNDPETGKPKTDMRNADASKRARPVIGVQIVIDMKRDGTTDTWKGQIYNAEDG